MQYQIYAREYFNQNYKVLMKTYSIIYTQLETGQSKLSSFQLSAKSAYYTIISHLQLDSCDHTCVIESYVKQNKEKPFKKFEQELALLIVIESRIHDLETQGLIKIQRNLRGETKITLTRKGKEMTSELKDLLSSEDDG